MSLFELQDQDLQGPNEFWIPFTESNERQIYRGKLSELYSNGIVIEREFILTESNLIKLDSKANQPKKIVPLSWKIIEPFVEDKLEIKRFGFSIGHRGSFRDFYVKSNEELDQWLMQLSKVGIMTDIEEDFDFIREVGKGAFAKVYLAKDNIDLATYAIKSIHKDKLSNNPMSITALINEIKVMRMLNHPNILKLHKVYESTKNVFLVLDYVPAGNLFTRITERKVFPEHVVIKFSQKFLEVLAYLNTLHVVHRDIKLENILMVSEDNDYDFRLADFGLATIATDGLTLRCGSPGYVAPEILSKSPYNGRVDLFSAGIIIYILLSGKMPFFGTSLEEIITKNRACRINFKDPALHRVSKKGLQLLKVLTEKEPENRINLQAALNDSWLRKPDDRNVQALARLSRTIGLDSKVMPKFNTNFEEKNTINKQFSKNNNSRVRAVMAALRNAE